MTDIDLYRINDIKERLVFISDAEDRLNIKLICNFAISNNCNVFGNLKNIINQIEYPNIIEKINNGYFDETLRYIFEEH